MKVILLSQFISKFNRPPEDKSYEENDLESEEQNFEKVRDFAGHQSSNTILSNSLNKPKVKNTNAKQVIYKSVPKIHIKSINNILSRELENIAEDNKLIHEELQRQQEDEAKQKADEYKFS